MLSAHRDPGTGGGPVVTDIRADVTDTSEGTAARLVVTGDLDLAVETELVDELTDLLRDARPDRLVVDLTAVPFIDSSGLRGLLRSARVAEDHGVLMLLAIAPGPVTLLLDTAGVRDWFSYE